MSRSLWGPQTDRAVANFRISGEPMPAAVVEWLARIKGACARANARLGQLDPDLAEQIANASDAIAAGEHPDQFPVDVFQTGSGTSTNMNVNEVISSLTDGQAHPNDHVNLGQSSNDTIPAAVQLAACASITSRLLPAVTVLRSAILGLADAHPDAVRPGRTHLMDAVPVLLADGLRAWAEQLDEAAEQIAGSRFALARLPLGGTAVGNGLGAHPEMATLVVAELAHHRRLGVPPEVARSRMARQGAHDALVGASGSLVVLATALTKIANDLRWMASGPNTGLSEIVLPELQKGSSIMPGKVNPVIPEVVLQVAAQVIGNNTTITVAGMQGNFELNVMVPVMARNLLASIDLLSAACESLARDCVEGIEVRVEHAAELAARSPALATALNARLGYDRVELIVREAVATRRSIREVAIEHGLPESDADELLDLGRIARGGR
jgi:fumarate hydratase, class II